MVCKKKTFPNNSVSKFLSNIKLITKMHFRKKANLLNFSQSFFSTCKAVISPKKNVTDSTARVFRKHRDSISETTINEQLWKR